MLSIYLRGQKKIRAMYSVNSFFFSIFKHFTNYCIYRNTRTWNDLSIFQLRLNKVLLEYTKFSMFIQEKDRPVKYFCVRAYFRENIFVKVAKILLFGDFFKANKTKPKSILKAKIFGNLWWFLEHRTLSLLRLFRVVTQVPNSHSILKSRNSPPGY